MPGISGHWEILYHYRGIQVTVERKEVILSDGFKEERLPDTPDNREILIRKAMESEAEWH